MKINIIKQKDQETNLWSGGTTTELFIYPETANYQERNFEFRLSTATVEVEKSDFTLLPNVKRKLMILDGGILIHHKGKPPKQMNKFEVHEFLGDWKTSSLGTCTDFNLMTKGNILGQISAIPLEKNQKTTQQIDIQSNWIFIYDFSGNIQLNLPNKKLSLEKGDLLIIKNPDIDSLSLLSIEPSILIFVELLT